MPKICEQVKEEQLSFATIIKAYIASCKGSQEPFRIEISSKIQDEIINRIYDRKQIEQVAAFHNLTVEGYLKAVKANTIPIKFINADMIFNGLLADNELIIFSNWKNVHVVFENLN